MQKITRFFAHHGLKVMIVSMIILFISILVPVPFYVEQPGSAKNLSDSVQIDDKKPTVDGEYLITAVGIRHVNIWGIFEALITPHQTIMSEDEVLGGASTRQDQALNALYMTSSINQAKANAYREAEIPFQRSFKGIYVINVQADSRFADVLEVGDMITKVNDKTFTSTQGFQDYVGNQAVGTPITITFERDGKTKEVTRESIQLGGQTKKSGIGIMLAEATDIQGTPKITADLGNIGGPSGGLMLTLEMYDALTKEDLARHRQIAGTGTIDANGQIGEIGGIDKKIIAARDAGATIFLAPYVKPSKAYQAGTGNAQTNYQIAVETAKKYAPNMTVVPVKTLNEAILYLRK